MSAKHPFRTLGSFVLLALSGCQAGVGPEGGEPPPFAFDDPWPEDLAAIWTETFSDGVGDQEALPPEMAGPPYAGPVPFPSIDVTEIRLGLQGKYLYMEVRFAGPIPGDVVHVTPNGEIEEQWVRNQGMNIALNTDDDRGTGGSGEGVQGIDIFFALSFDYGVRSNVYANWSFPDGDVHHNEFQMPGELGPGGVGHDHAVVRYDVSDLSPTFFPIGVEVEIGSWSEAESFDQGGQLKYHHFAFDRVIDEGLWFIGEGEAGDARIPSKGRPLVP